MQARGTADSADSGRLRLALATDPLSRRVPQQARALLARIGFRFEKLAHKIPGDGRLPG